MFELAYNDKRIHLHLKSTKDRRAYETQMKEMGGTWNGKGWVFDASARVEVYNFLKRLESTEHAASIKEQTKYHRERSRGKGASSPVEAVETSAPNPSGTDPPLSETFYKNFVNASPVDEAASEGGSSSSGSDSLDELCEHIEELYARLETMEEQVREVTTQLKKCRHR